MHARDEIVVHEALRPEAAEQALDEPVLQVQMHGVSRPATLDPRTRPAEPAVLCASPRAAALSRLRRAQRVERVHP